MLIAALSVPILAKLCINDPGDYEDLNSPSTLAANAILANYNITPTLYQTNAISGPYNYSGGKKNKVISDKTLEVDKNDTSVVVVTEGYIPLLKFSLTIAQKHLT